MVHGAGNLLDWGFIMKIRIGIEISIISVKARLLMISVFALFFTLSSRSQNVFTVDTLSTLVDGLYSPYNQVEPGDTIFLEAGMRRLIRIRNLTGAPGKPVVIINKNGKVVFDSDYTYGISILNCRYIRVTGSGDPDHFYGIVINQVTNGTGIGISGMSSDYEIDHLSISYCKSVGIFAKTDPDCGFLSTRDKFIQFNTIIHDNYVSHTGTEAMYIGSTQYFGQKITCNGVDTLLMPSLLDGVKVYNNKIDSCGWDGIQVTSASKNCRIYNNEILNYSLAESYGQMSGIIIGGGSKCDCYNNLISQGKGMGIESFGLGGQKIYNNIILDAGKNFFPADTNRQVHGIFVTDITTQADSSLYIFNNDIINPMSDGIRFQSTITRGNIVASNLIVNPGNFDHYENEKKGHRGKDSYVMLTSANTEIALMNNFFTRSLDSAKISESNYIPRPGSPLINSGWPGSTGINFDFLGNLRPIGKACEIGALEFDPATVGLTIQQADKAYGSTIFPNPVKGLTTISYHFSRAGRTTILIYDLQGHIVFKKEEEYLADSYSKIQFDASRLENGLYLYLIKKGVESLSGKLMKIN
jgi:hypothetical protein